MYIIAFSEEDYNQLCSNLYDYYTVLAFDTSVLLKDQHILKEDKDFLNNRLDKLLVLVKKLDSVINTRPKDNKVFIFKDIKLES